jgi:hypothetical protein
MSGFDNAKVDAEFFSGTAVKSNFLINIGHGAPSMSVMAPPQNYFLAAQGSASRKSCAWCEALVFRLVQLPKDLKSPFFDSSSLNLQKAETTLGLYESSERLGVNLSCKPRLLNWTLQVA